MCSGTSSLGSATMPSGNSGKSRSSSIVRAYLGYRRGTVRFATRDGPVRPARPAAGRAAASADRRADAARRAGGELLVPAPSRRLRVDRRPRPRTAGRRSRVRRGLRQRRARAHGRRCRRRRGEPRGVRARAAEVRRRKRVVRARHDRDLERGRRLCGPAPDDRARPGPRRGARAAARPRRAAGGRLRVDAERADAGAEGRAAVREPLARARVPAGGVPRALRAPLRRRRPARAVPRAQAAPARAGARARRVGCGARAAAHHEGVLRPLHPGDHRTRLPPPPGRARARAGSARRAAAMSRPAGALAIVLHTHMPYVEGFGTWPFGEEWLWEAVANCYLPLLDLLDAAPGRLTLSVTPVLGDQLEAPGALARCAEFLLGVRRETHRLDIAAARSAGEAAALEHSAAAYERAADAIARGAGPEGAPAPVGGDIAARLAAYATWTSAATHAALPLLATAGGVRLQLATGIAAHRARSGRWGGGLWLPECAHAPWLDPLLEEAGVRAACVDLTDVLGRGSDAQLRPLRSPAGPLLAPLDRELIELVWSASGYPSRAAYRDSHRLTAHRHLAWAVDGTAYDPGRAAARARADARDFVEQAAARVRRGGLAVFAVDTELLGLHWHEGVAWLAAVLAAAEDGRLRIAPLDELLHEHEPVPAPELPVTSWGTPRDLSTWSAPPAGGLAWRQRAAELRAVAALPGVPDRALRELLALQSSDWAFMAARATAGPYPFERAAAHAAAFEAPPAAPGQHA